ncbi:MAG: DUF4145 domain-containing protein [Desulfobaccales bacterium]
MALWNIEWNNPYDLPSRDYICGYCNKPLASAKGWFASSPGKNRSAIIYICHHCKSPTFFDPLGSQTPGIIFGNPVSEINEQSLESLYNEARKTTGTGSYTAAVLCCRKLLMHIAVSKGAKEGDSFINYVQFLADNNYIPPDAKDWVDHIRKKGNEANHEIAIMLKEDAEELLSFIEMLLKLIYEFPALIKKKLSSPGTSTPGTP